MYTPWGMIRARKLTAEYAKKLEDLQCKVDKALKLLKMDNPDIQLVIRILEEKVSEPNPGGTKIK